LPNFNVKASSKNNRLLDPEEEDARMDDFQLVRQALRLARRLARHHRRGGLADLWQLAGEALAALARIEAGSPEQLPLALFPRDLSRQAHDLQSQAVALNREAFDLEERATAWVRAQMSQGVLAGGNGGDC
jgi:hypothetical protein